MKSDLDTDIRKLIDVAAPVSAAEAVAFAAAIRADGAEAAHERARDDVISPSHRVGTRWTHPRRLVAVAAAVLLIGGLSTFFGARGANTPSLTNSIAQAFGVVNADASTAGGFSSVPSSPQGISVLTCPTAEVCYLESTSAQPGVTPYNPVTTVYKTVDGGMTWSPLTLPVTGNADTSMSCSSVTVCSLGVQTSPTTPQAPPAKGTAQLMLTTTDGGQTWTSHVVPINPVLGYDAALDLSLENVQGMWTQLQCFSATSCIAVALAHSDQPVEASGNTEGVLRTVIMRTDDGGVTWTSNVLPWSNAIDGSPGWSNAQVMSLSCATATNCVGLSTVFHSVVDNSQSASVLVWRSDDGGATWQTNWAPAPAHAQTSSLRLTCPTALQCYAPVSVGPIAPGGATRIMSTDDGGVTWSFSAPPTTGSATLRNQYSSLSCTSASTCWMSGEILTSGAPGSSLANSQAAIWATTDSGNTWESVPVPTGLGIVFQVTCNAPASCLAVAQPPYKSGQAAPSGPLPGEILSNQSS